MATEVFPPGWYVIAESAEISARGPTTIERFATKLVLWRDASGHIAALDDRCPHRAASLGLGRVIDGCIACPFHGFRYDATGHCVEAPVLGTEGKIPRALAARPHTVRESDNWVWLWWGEQPAVLPDIPGFEHLRGDYRTRTMVREWDASFVRVIENQLDPFHLPFVHRTTIGRGMKPAMQVWTEVHEDRVRAGVLRGDGVASEFYIEFRWANLWENHISPKFSIVAAFAPIDACRTRTYLRNYQRMVMVPGIGWLFDVALLWSNRKIFAQDEQVVVSQPQHPLIPEGDVMVKADAAIIAYRKMLARNLRPAMRSAAECV